MSTPLLITDAELLALGIGYEALTDVDSTVRTQACRAASGVVLSYLKKRYDLTDLAGWSDDVKDATASIAAWRILSRRGYNPQSTIDIAIKANADVALQWLQAVALGSAEVYSLTNVGGDSLTEVNGPLVSSNDLIDWTYPGPGGDGWGCGCS